MNQVGVVLGRFQVASLHDGHVALLTAVSARCRQLVVLIGVSPAQFNLRDPLPFVCREAAVRSAFPEAIVLPVEDQSSDAYWSERVDAALATLGSDITIFGGRDNSLAKYSGRWPTETLADVGHPDVAGEHDRAAEYIRRSPLFRAGMVYAAKIRYPTAFQTVDVVATQGMMVLAGRKRGETAYRFPGGFVDPVHDRSLEAAAKREFTEECGLLETGPMIYIGSTRVDDWRYRASTDKITTAVFTARVLWGTPVAGDDLDFVVWMTPDALRSEIHPVHKPLLDLYERHLNGAADVQHAESVTSDRQL